MRTHTKYSLLVLWLFLFPFGSRAFTVHSVTSGNWTNPATWDLGVPGTYDSVIVQHYVILNTNVSLILPGKLFITPTGTLCGLYSYEGAFFTEGPLNLGSLYLTGPSDNYGPVQITSFGIVSSSWSTHNTVCVGCTFTCYDTTDFIMPSAAFNPDTICVNQNLLLTNSSVNNLSNEWHMPGAAITFSTAANPTVSYSTPGTYIITLICHNTFGSDTTTNSIVVLPAPVLIVTNDTTVCANVPFNLEASGPGMIEWSPPAGLSCTNCSNPLVTVVSDMVYTVTLTDSYGCLNTESVQIQLSNPVSSLLSSYALCQGSPVTVTLDTTMGFSYFWSTGENGNQLTFNAAQTVQLLITDSLGCTTSDSTEIIVRENPSVEIENDTTICLKHPLTLYNSSEEI